MNDQTLAGFGAACAAVGAVLVAIIKMASSRKSVNIADQALIISNLNDEVERLGAQVDRLETKIDRLDRQLDNSERAFTAEIMLLHAYIVDLGGDPTSLPRVRPSGGT